MKEHQVSRTLLKSPPELWAECSDGQSLTKHLKEFGEIRISKLEPEHTVAWEGDHASGTVRLEPSGWGTKVALTVIGERDAPAGGDQTPPVAAPDPEPPPVRVGVVARMRRWFSPESAGASAPAAAEPEPAERVPSSGDATAVLNSALDSLGKAHHRPFSRA